MCIIRIGSLNMQNSRMCAMASEKKDNFRILAHHIENYGYCFLGIQELTRELSKKLLNTLKNYKLYGNYRYGSSKLVQSMGTLDSFNENNAIITNRQVLNTTTKLLPWFPNNFKDLFQSLKKVSMMPRIVTIAQIKDSTVGIIYAVNTHLDYQSKSVQIRQLKRLYKILETLNKKYPIVLTGDFNMELGKDEHFSLFIKKIENIGLKRVSMNDTTFVKRDGTKKTIDHIFIPKSWIVEKAGLIEDETLNLLTDHKGVYVDVRVK